jgi:hypothetical protein
LVFFDGVNNYYVRKESPGVIARFAYVADLFDFLRKNSIPKPTFIQRVKRFIKSVL